MEYNSLGRTNLNVSRVGFGGGGIGEVWGPTTRDEAVRAIHRALDLGINYFDVAPAYGDGKLTRYPLPTRRRRTRLNTEDET